MNILLNKIDNSLNKKLDNSLNSNNKYGKLINMENKKSNKPRYTIFNFNAAYEPPTNKYNVGKGYVEWGDKNLYPNYLIDLYNYKGSTTHQATIDRKVGIISGRGFEPIKDMSLLKLVKRTKLSRQVKQATLDYELINGFAFEVIWANDGESIASIKSIQRHKVREGIESKDVDYPHYVYSKDWSQYRKEGYEPEIIRKWNPLIRQGKQIYVYDEYNPGMDVYPIANYSNSFNYIELDHEISKFHLNQVKQGYSPSFILNFATGIPTEEEMDEFNTHFERNYAGSENAGKIIITYSEGADQQPKLEAIQLNDSDERFAMLIDQIETQIIRGSRVPPQLLLLVAGSLGGVGERDELLEEFQIDYVTPRQETIEEVLNEILLEGGYTEELKLKKYEITKKELK